jgi:WD40 repeat protein
MGDCCGPCHDRRLEAGRDSISEPPLTWSNKSRAVSKLQFLRGGSLLAVVTRRGTAAHVEIRRWPESSLVVDKQVRLVTTTGLVSFAENEVTAVLDSRHTFVRLDLGGEDTSVQESPGRGFRSLALSDDGQILAGLEDQGLRLVDGEGRELLVEREMFVQGHLLHFAPARPLLALGTVHGWVHLLDARTGEVVRQLGERPGSVTEESWKYVRSLAFPPDSRRLAVGCGVSLDPAEAVPDDAPCQVQVWDLEQDTEPVTLTAHQGSVTALTFSPDGTLLASGGMDGVIRFWDLTSRQEVLGLEWHLGAVTTLAFSPDGRWLLSGGADGAVRVWPWKQLLAF